MKRKPALNLGDDGRASLAQAEQRLVGCNFRYNEGPWLVLWALLLAALTASAHTPGLGDQGVRGGEDSVCLDCHKQQSLSYLHTAHHNTSSAADEGSMRHALGRGASTLVIVDPKSKPQPGLSFVMKAEDGHYSETAVTGWGTDLQRWSEPIDIVIGSGKRGQTYLYWRGDRLFELPVSYWTDGQQWINSPGYVDGTADFNRPVHPGCLECHATRAVSLSADPSTNRYDRASLIFGLHCETCHGPGLKHVAVERSGAQPGGVLRDTAILNPARFSRDRQVDLCALCHSGIKREALAPAFSYVPGQPLGNYFKQASTPLEDRPDVHGNQVGLLGRSRCFLASPQMTCSTCHDVHAAGQPAATYSKRCLGCHQWQSCGLARKLGQHIASNCVDCHMPVLATNVIVSTTADKELRATMRSHWIKVYEGNKLRPHADSSVE